MCSFTLKFIKNEKLDEWFKGCVIFFNLASTYYENRKYKMIAQDFDLKWCCP